MMGAGAKAKGMILKQFIQAFCSESERDGGHRMHRGCIKEDLAALTPHVPAGFVEVPAWRLGQLRCVWKWDGAWATITYREHDIWVRQHFSAASYQKELADAARFYAQYS